MKKVIFFILLILIVLLIVVNIYDKCLKNIYPDTYAEYVDKYSEKYGIEREWIFSLIKSESNFNKDIVSRSGAIGLMQLMENTAEEVSDKIRNGRV